MSPSNRPNLAAIGMRGNRFPALTWETMTPAQVQMTEQVLAGKRGSMQGPYNVLLRSPELGNLAQQFGAHTRFHSSLPLALNELAILLVAHFWQSPFVWWAHKAIALEAGLDAALVDAIAASQAPHGLESSGLEKTKAVYDFCSELLQTRRASDAAFANMKTHFGEQGIVDTMGTMSYYTLVSMCLNVDQYPVPV